MKISAIGNIYPGKFENLQKALDEGESSEWTRDDVFEIVENFLDSSDRIGFDSLDHLRSVFPFYEWQCYEVIESYENGSEVHVQQAFRSLLQQADFFWLVGGMASDWVVARRRDRVGSGLSLCGSKELREDLNGLLLEDPTVSLILRMLGGAAVTFKDELKDKPDV